MTGHYPGIMGAYEQGYNDGHAKASINRDYFTGYGDGYTAAKAEWQQWMTPVWESRESVYGGYTITCWCYGQKAECQASPELRLDDSVLTSILTRLELKCFDQFRRNRK